MMQSIRMTMNAKRAAQFLFGSVSAGLLLKTWSKFQTTTSSKLIKAMESQRK